MRGPEFRWIFGVGFFGKLVDDLGGWFGGNAWVRPARFGPSDDLF
ncbi:MAG: hypothetical protein WCE62_05495 [Polyangiales bacterium]